MQRKGATLLEDRRLRYMIESTYQTEQSSIAAAVDAPPSSLVSGVPAEEGFIERISNGLIQLAVLLANFDSIAS
jgi:hypothetical protein